MIKEDQLLPMTKKDQGLKWLPWIGENYFTLAPQKRLLIVGERYLRPEAAQLIDYSINSHCIKWMIEDVAAGRQGYGKEFETISAAVTGHADGDSSRFWNQVSFYEFVQRPLESDDLPCEEDLEAGWKVFFELTAILKPGICLFAGTRAAGFLKAAMSGTSGARLLSLESRDAVDGITPVCAHVQTPAGQEIKIIFIGDAAGTFDPEAWHEFLREQEGLTKEFSERSALNTH